MKRFVVGDIHGAYKALEQCLERSGFDRDKDLLISLGDISDGWPEVHKTIDLILSLKNFQVVLGNHDAWALRWMLSGWKGSEWTGQGGEATLESYQNSRKNVPQSHKQLFESAPFFLELGNKLFVHGGLESGIEIRKQDPEFLLWDRNLLYDAVRKSRMGVHHQYGPWEDIFIGHTTTQVYKTFEPIHACNVWAMDTGAGWSGKLTLMDVDSHQFWQSDFTPDLYPEHPGRR